MNPQNNLISTEIKNFNQTLDFVNSVSAKHHEEKQKLPYHINILDLIWANEDGHSKIISQLFKQKSNGSYEIFDSFMEYLHSEKNNFPRHLVSPKINTNKNNIDILIEGKDSVFIIENKIHDAVDQPAQLARYINRVKNTVGKNKNIYILYLTKDGTKKPSPDTWKLNGEDYYKTYETKFFEINFRYDILPWLKTQILPNIGLKDVFLKSTVEQYIDYLEGFFNQRTIHKNMNEELKKHINETLGLGESLEENIKLLEDKSKEIDQVKNQIIAMIDSTRQSMWSVWYNQLKSDFSNLVQVNPEIFSDSHKHQKVGVQMIYQDCKFSVSLEGNGNNLYLGIGGYGNSSENLLEPIKSLTIGVYKNYIAKNDPGWYAWQYTNYQDAYSELSSLINHIESYISENSNK